MQKYELSSNSFNVRWYNLEKMGTYMDESYPMLVEALEHAKCIVFGEDVSSLCIKCLFFLTLYCTYYYREGFFSIV